MLKNDEFKYYRKADVKNHGNLEFYKLFHVQIPKPKVSFKNKSTHNHKYKVYIQKQNCNSHNYRPSVPFCVTIWPFKLS